MLKVLAAVLAVLSAAISITIYTATLPAVQKQAEDNAAAIEQNAEDISSVDNSVDGLNTRIETVESKFYKYCHKVEISGYEVVTYIYNNSNTQFTKQTLHDYILNLPEKALLNYQVSTITQTGTGSTLIKLYLVSTGASDLAVCGYTYNNSIPGLTTYYSQLYGGTVVDTVTTL